MKRLTPTSYVAVRRVIWIVFFKPFVDAAAKYSSGDYKIVCSLPDKMRPLLTQIPAAGVWDLPDLRSMTGII